MENKPASSLVSLDKVLNEIPLPLSSLAGSNSGNTAQLVERRASNQKVAKPWFDSRCGSASLCP